MKTGTVVASGVVSVFLTLLLAQPGAAGRVRTSNGEAKNIMFAPQGACL